MVGLCQLKSFLARRVGISFASATPADRWLDAFRANSDIVPVADFSSMNGVFADSGGLNRV